MRPATEDLFRWGAISSWAVSRDHEFWRLLAGTFLHGGAIHLGMNMLGLWGAGKLLNRMYGNGQFLLVYLLSALAGASASLHFSALAAVSVGASGAVFGVIGALVVAVRKRREHLPKAVVKQIMTSEAVFLLYALVNGFARTGIDNAAHVGGLLAGGAMGLVLAGAVDATTEATRRLRAGGIAAAVLAIVGVMVATTPEPRVDHARMFATTGRLQDLVPRLQGANAALQKDIREAQAGRIGQEQLAGKVAGVHLPALRKLHGELQQVPRAQGDPRNGMTDDMQAVAAKGIEAMEIELRAQRGQARAEDQGRPEALQREIEAITRRMQERAAAAKAPKKS
jgi:rhomboid protease GluP